jgi:hypothetical protein
MSGCMSLNMRLNINATKMRIRPKRTEGTCDDNTRKLRERAEGDGEGVVRAVQVHHDNGEGVGCAVE